MRISKECPAAVRLIDAHEEHEGGGLAAAAVTCEGDIFTLLYLKIETFHGFRHVVLCQFADGACCGIVCVGDVFKSERSETVIIEIPDCLLVQIITVDVVCKALDLHESLGTCEHLIVSGKIACYVCKRRLDLGNELCDRSQCTIGDRTC